MKLWNETDADRSPRLSAVVLSCLVLSCLVLQWTGGRGGGHHSFEDHHAPMLTKYGAIRREKNIVLVCGSGFGDAKGSMPYLTGTAYASFCDAI